MNIIILCPPINLYSKPWQHAFDKRIKPMATKNPHDAIRIYWERSGRPKVEFNNGGVWLETDHPTWNPHFKYRLIGEQGTELKPANFTSEYRQGYDDGFSVGFKAGMDKAVEDMKIMLAEKQRRTNAKIASK